MHFCRSWFSNMVSFRYVLVFLNFLLLLYDSQILFNTITFYKVSFFCKHNFLSMRSVRNENTKVKVFHQSISCFMKWPSNCIWWNVKHWLLRKTDVIKTCRTSKFLGKKIWRNALALKNKKVKRIFGEKFILALFSSAAFRLQNRVSDFF